MIKNRQDGKLVAEIVRDKKQGGFVVIDQGGEQVSEVCESLDFARAELLLFLGQTMKEIALSAYKYGAENYLKIQIKGDEAYFSLAPTIINDRY